MSSEPENRSSSSWAALELRSALRLWPLAVRPLGARREVAQSEVVTCLGRIASLGRALILTESAGARQFLSIRAAVRDAELLCVKLNREAGNADRTINSRIEAVLCERAIRAAMAAGIAIGGRPKGLARASSEGGAVGLGLEALKFIDDDGDWFRETRGDDTRFIAGDVASVPALMALPLWPTSQLRKSVMARIRSWEDLRSGDDNSWIWAEFFEARVRGSAAGFNLTPEADGRLERRLLAADEDWWGRKPLEVNSEILSWLAGLRGARDSDQITLDDQMAEEASPVIISDDRDRITVEPNPIHDRITNRAVLKKSLRDLRSVTDVLSRCLETNRLSPALCVTVSCYHSEIIKAEDDISWGYVERLGRAILAGHGSTDSREFDEVVWVHFDSFFELHGTCLKCSAQSDDFASAESKLTFSEPQDMSSQLRAILQNLADISASLEAEGRVTEEYVAYIEQVGMVGRDMPHKPAALTSEGDTWRTKALKSFAFGLGGTLEGLRKIFENVEWFSDWASANDAMSKLSRSLDEIKKWFRV